MRRQGFWVHPECCIVPKGVEGEEDGLYVCMCVQWRGIYSAEPLDLWCVCILTCFTLKPEASASSGCLSIGIPLRL